MEVESSKMSTTSTVKTAKEKRIARDVRDIKRQQPNAPIRLNKRLRKIKTAAEINAIPEAYAKDDICIDRNMEEEEPLNTKFSTLKFVNGVKRHREPEMHETSKKRKVASNSEESEDDDQYETEEDEENNGHEADENVDVNKIIEELSKEKNNGSKQKVWFDGVDPMLLEDDVEVDMDKEEELANPQYAEALKRSQISEDMIKEAVALDCEMVGCGEIGSINTLARVSIVDKNLKVVYESHVQPPGPVIDYRTKYSGIRPKDLDNAPPFKVVQRQVAQAIKGKILVAHSVKNDLDVLMISHPRHLIRDTSTYEVFRKKYQGYAPSLKNLARDYLHMNIQDGEHDSVEDARATMKLYLMHYRDWETVMSGLSRNSQRKFQKVKEKRRKGFKNFKKTHNRSYRSRSMRKRRK